MSVQDQKPKWAQHFKIDDATLAKLQALALKNKSSALDVAIDMGVINHENLLTWDRDNSKTPTLKIDFFNTEPPLELFQKFDYLKCRQKACMPVTEWNGNIYWAKLSSDFTGFEKENSQPLWFLAPWAGLKKWFAAWKAVAVIYSPPMNASPMAAFIDSPQSNASPTEIVLEPTQQASQAPTEFGFEFGEGEAQAPPDQSQSRSFTGTEMNLISNVSPSESSSAPLELESANEALANESSRNNQAHDNSSLILEKTFVEPQAETLILKGISGSAVTPQIQLEKPLRPENSSKALNPHFPPQVESRPVKTSAEEVKLVAAAIDFSSLMGAPRPPLPLPKPALSEPLTDQLADQLPPPPDSGIYEQVTSVDPIQITPPLPVPAPQAVAGKKLTTIPLDQFESRLRLATHQDALAETFMGAWQNYFEQVMILLIQNNQPAIWWHNFQFKGQFKRSEIIPVNTPSAFKIVIDTSHPYHGYVSHGAVHDNFFKLVNSGRYPEHLTIIPVISNDRVVAMVLGMCTKERGKEINLPKIEEDARLFSNFLTRLSTPVQRAS